MDAKVKRGLNELGVTEIVVKIAAGEITCEAVCAIASSALPRASPSLKPG